MTCLFTYANIISMKRTLLTFVTSIVFLFISNSYASTLAMPAKVITKTPTFVLTLTGLDVAAMAVIPLSKYFDMASHDPDGAKEYLSKHPVQRNVIRVKTFSALRKAQNHQDYQRIHDSAIDYFGFTGLPPYEGADLDTSIPGYKSDVIEHAPIINPIRDARPDDIILVNPITKIKINVTMEYPTEDIQNWKDYMIVIKDSTILGKNLEKAGQIRPKNAQAHHIIPVNAEGADDARDIWKTKCGQDINSAENGVFLPNGKNIDPSLANAIIHWGQHGDIHTTKVNNEIVSAYQRGGCKGVSDKINAIKNKLLNGKNNKWSNVL